eukprot:11312557-Heterocapsa_arctica.AAC.1
MWRRSINTERPRSDAENSSRGARGGPSGRTGQPRAAIAAARASGVRATCGCQVPRPPTPHMGAAP